ncbi:MAG: hypothetical protein N2376_06725 [Clostridia bacterium]|nr:hypothetical protein [Clostridia bacterium]
MKTKLLASILGAAILSTLLSAPAFAATSQTDPKTQRTEIRQLGQQKKEKAQTLKALVTEAREQAGIVPLTENEKALLKAARDEIAPLVQQLKQLKSDYADAKLAGDSAKIASIKEQVNALRTEIKSQWEKLADLRAKAKANREKAAASYRTESFAAGQKQRHELFKEGTALKAEIKDLAAQLKEAKASNDDQAAALLQEQLSAKLDTLSDNISQRMELIDTLIGELIK